MRVDVLTQRVGVLDEAARLLIIGRLERIRGRERRRHVLTYSAQVVVVEPGAMRTELAGQARSPPPMSRGLS